MKPVKLCYWIRCCIKQPDRIQESDPFFERLIVWYYTFFKSGKSGVSQANRRKRKLIVSLTSIPPRMDKVWITIESLLRQTYKPDRIILWLSEDEFRDVKLSEKIKEQQSRGLQICYCDNLRSYKKFYYTAKRFPDDYIVTVDDDVIYAEDMLETLVRTYRKHPGCIVCNRSHYIKRTRSGLAAYDQWLKYDDRGKKETEASFNNFFTGCGGDLFPMFRMDRKVFEKEVFMELAPYADDVWLNFCAWISGIKSINTSGILGHVLTIESSSKKGLSKMNLGYRGNDVQIKQVLAYFKIDVNEYLKQDSVRGFVDGQSVQ